MASKFQNRLVGTIVLVALGVIILPGLLDGQKKHYQDEFAAIPLVPKPGDRDEPDMLPAATQALPSQPPEGAAEEVRAGDAAAPSLDPSRRRYSALVMRLPRRHRLISHRKCVPCSMRCMSPLTARKIAGNDRAHSVSP